MFSRDNKAYQWFYCPECMARYRAKITDNGKVELRLYDKKPKGDKKWKH